MFKTISTPEKVNLVKEFFPGKSYTSNEPWLVFNIETRQHGWAVKGSIIAAHYLELKNINRVLLNKLVLLHSIGFTPKEIAEILNGESDVLTST